MGFWESGRERKKEKGGASEGVVVRRGFPKKFWGGRGGGPIERIGLCWMEDPPLTRSQVSQVFIGKYLKVSILIATHYARSLLV
jgi:hypothetical protein